MDRPTLFIGSSTEGKEIANALRANLGADAEVTVWDEGVFQLGSTTIESLERELRSQDFALLVLTPDDVLLSRGESMAVPRDNVMFEWGLFTGCLGRERAFVVHDETQDIKLPTDVLGLTAATFRGDRADGDLAAAVGSACDKIRSSISRLGPLERSASTITVTDGSLSFRPTVDGWLHPVQIRERDGGIETKLRNTLIEVNFGRIEDYPPVDNDTVVVLPANEFFDDECISDARSALGAFMEKHFADELREPRKLLASALADRESTLVAKREGAVEPSYGVGTCVFMDSILDLDGSVALAAVTTQRQNEGLRSELSFILRAVTRVVEAMADRRLHTVVFPLLGSGHGGMSPELALFALLLAIGENASGPCASQLRRVKLVIFRKDATAQPALDVAAVKEILRLCVGMYT